MQTHQHPSPAVTWARREQSAAQYERYINRFGPGLVIYWHGFIADLQQHEGGELLLLDRFPMPDELVQLPCLPLSLAALPDPAAADQAPTAAAVVQGGAGGALAGDAAAGREASTGEAAPAAHHMTE